MGSVLECYEMQLNLPLNRTFNGVPFLGLYFIWPKVVPPWQAV